MVKYNFRKPLFDLGVITLGKSKAQKIREKRIREGKLDPLQSRGTHFGLYERKTKTKKEKFHQQFHKHKKDLRRWENEDLFYFCLL